MESFLAMKSSVFLILIAFSTRIQGYHARVPYVQDSQCNILPSMVNSLIDRFCKDDSYLVVSSDVVQNISPILKILHSGLKCTIRMCQVNGSPSTETREQANNFLFLVYSNEMSSDIFTQIESVYQRFKWNSQSRVFVTVFNYVRDTWGKAYYFMEKLSKILNKEEIGLFTFERDSNINPLITLYVWRQRFDENCRRIFKERLSNRKSVIHHSEKENLKSVEFPRLSHFCYITASTFELPPYVMMDENVNQSSSYSYTKGLEIQLVNAVSELFGYQVYFKEPPPRTSEFDKWGGRLSNGTWVGILGNMMNKHADVAFCGFNPNVKRSMFMDMTDGHIRNFWQWYVPTRKPVLNFMSLIFIFHFKIWVALIISFVLFTVTMQIFGRKVRNIEGFISFSFIVLNCWSALIGVGLGHLPKTSRVRLLFGVWLLSCLVIYQAYQTILVSMLTSKKAGAQIRTVRELINSGLHYGALPGLRSFFANSSDPIDNEIYDNYEACPTLPECIDKMLKHDFAMFANAMHLQYSVHPYLVPEGKAFIHALEDGSINFDDVMYLRKSSPFLDSFNIVFRRIKEAGILNKWWIDMKNEKILKEKNKYALEYEFTALNLTHFGGLFLILLLGISISVLVLWWEVAFRRNLNQKKHIGTTAILDLG